MVVLVPAQSGPRLCPPFDPEFIYTDFDFYNPHYVKFICAMAIMGCLSAPLLILGGCYLIGSSMKGRRKLGDTSVVTRMREAIQSEGVDVDLGGVKRSGTTRIIMVASILLGGCGGIASVEKMISLNDIDLSEVGFLSTGRLIPFLVALFTFISTAWAIITAGDDDDDRYNPHAIVFLSGNLGSKSLFCIPSDVRVIDTVRCINRAKF